MGLHPVYGLFFASLPWLIAFNVPISLYYGTVDMEYCLIKESRHISPGRLALSVSPLLGGSDGVHYVIEPCHGPRHCSALLTYLPPGTSRPCMYHPHGFSWSHPSAYGFSVTSGLTDLILWWMGAIWTSVSLFLSVSVYHHRRDPGK